EVVPVAEEYAIDPGPDPVIIRADSYAPLDEGLSWELADAAAAAAVTVRHAAVTRYGSDASSSLDSGRVPRSACLAAATENTHGFEIAHLGALADRGGAALDRACPHVAGGIDARHGRLEKALRASVRAGQDEPVGIPRDRVTEPFGAGRSTEEQEQEGERKLLAVDERDRMQSPALSLEAHDFAAIAHGYSVPVERVDQILRHRLAEVVPAVQERHQRAPACQPDGS